MMKKLIKYFLDFYIELVEHAKSKGFNLEDDNSLFQVFLSLILGFLFMCGTTLFGIISILVYLIVGFGGGYFAALAIICCIVMIIFFIYSFVKLAEIFGWVRKYHRY